MSQPLINGRAYDWAQVAVRMSNGTLPFYGIKAVSYSDEQEIENNYGAGNMPTSRGFGNYTPTASITLTMEEVERIQQSVPSGRLQDINEFDLIISFVHPSVNRIVTHSIRNCRFRNNQRELEQNAKEFEVELELIPSHIEWNGAKILGLGNT